MRYLDNATVNGCYYSAGKQAKKISDKDVDSTEDEKKKQKEKEKMSRVLFDAVKSLIVLG
eukprot:13579715-Ditylum_brightwellii.AAC.1